jgi:MFS family permease
MASFNHLIFHFKKYGSTHKKLYLLSLILFFWALFDGILSYTTPLVFVSKGLNNTMMGFVMASSSVAGALFDFALSRLMKNTHFRRLYLIMFSLCFVYPLLLWKAQAFWLFLVIMAVWGLYYDLENFGLFDFVSRHTQKEEHSSSFGVVSVFKSLGYLIAPIFAGFLIGQVIDWQPFFLAWFFLVVSFVFFLILYLKIKKNNHHNHDENVRFKPVKVVAEIKLWKRVAVFIWPVLSFTILLNIADAFFWTIGPIFSEKLANLHPLGGLFLSLYMLPSLIVGWFVGPITRKFGKKKTAFVSFFGGSLFLIFLGMCRHPALILMLTLLFSFLYSLAWPSIKGSYADYISETPPLEKEVEALEDFSTNIGYVIGPITAGILADRFNSGLAFSILGLVGIIWVIFLLKITPKEINLK